MCHIHLDRAHKRFSRQIPDLKQRHAFLRYIRELVKSSTQSDWKQNLKKLKCCSAYKNNENVRNYIKFEVVPFKRMMATCDRVGLNCPNTTNMAESLFHSFKTRYLRGSSDSSLCSLIETLIKFMLPEHYRDFVRKNKWRSSNVRQFLNPQKLGSEFLERPQKVVKAMYDAKKKCRSIFCVSL